MSAVRQLYVFVAVILLTLKSDSLSLHITNGKQRSHFAENCEEVLTKNLECPSIGSYPVAGVCDYFVRCIQTKSGVEAEVDFCPDGQVYVTNRCVRSPNSDDCPQKHCNPSTIIITPTTLKATTVRPFFTTNNPLIHLHPSRNNNAMQNRNNSGNFYSLLLLAIFACSQQKLLPL